MKRRASIEPGTEHLIMDDREEKTCQKTGTLNGSIVTALMI
jgi:hypothetical protein